MPNEYNPQQCGNSKHLRNKMLMYSALHSDMQQFIRERYWCYEPIGTLGQNLPSNSKYGKLIKSCVQAPEGFYDVNIEGIDNIIQTMNKEYIINKLQRIQYLGRHGSIRGNHINECDEIMDYLYDHMPKELFNKLCQCIHKESGWLFVGLDFASLEDRISALTTKDKNKLLVYLEDYDAHALRACAYFAENMPDIIEKRKEVSKQGQTYKVVYSDGGVDYFNESNPILVSALQELKEK